MSFELTVKEQWCDRFTIITIQKRPLKNCCSVRKLHVKARMSNRYVQHLQPYDVPPKFQPKWRIARSMWTRVVFLPWLYVANSKYGTKLVFDWTSRGTKCVNRFLFHRSSSFNCQGPSYHKSTVLRHAVYMYFYNKNWIMFLIWRTFGEYVYDKDIKFSLQGKKAYSACF